MIEMYKVDVHVHPLLVSEILEKYSALLSKVREIFGIGTAPQPVEIILRQMDIADIDKVILLPIDCRTRFGVELPPIEAVMELVEKYPDRLLGFTSIDPMRADAVELLKKQVSKYEVKGVKLNPALQGFNPLDNKVLEFLKKCMELELPVLVHTGHVWTERDNVEYVNPLIWDRIATLIPDLKIILAHMGFPWLWETFIVLTRHKNVYTDISNVYTGSPMEHLKYILTEALPRRIIERFLSDKVIFGSDYPRIEINKMAEALDRLDIDSQVKERIYGLNLRKVVKL